MLTQYKELMIFAVVGVAWLLSALCLGSLLGRCVVTADRRQVDGHTADPGAPLYVADILRAQSAVPRG
jgi:hypothetical protein